MQDQKSVPETKIQFTNGREHALSVVEKISTTVMRETASKKRTYIVYAEIEGSGSLEACVANTRAEADNYSQKWRAVLAAFNELRRDSKEGGRDSEIAPTEESEVRKPRQRGMEDPDSNRKRAMRAAFAIAAKILTTEQRDLFWRYIRVKTGVASRRNLTEQQLVMAEARLRAAEESQQCKAQLLAEMQGLGDPEQVRLFKVVRKTELKRGGWVDYCPVYELVEQADTIGENAVQKIEDYADRHNTDMLIVYPDGRTRAIRAVEAEHRQEMRDNPPAFRETWCKRCSTVPKNCKCGEFRKNNHMGRACLFRP